jgi:Kdo2-lipid IVA lauroyltransferase/acyltransferase
MNIVNRLLYYLVILPISSLPFPLLYALSDFLFFMLYHVTGYRKGVVMGNIERSFPEKTAMEHKDICRKFYHHFCDLVLESLKTFTISEKEIKKRVIFKNPEVADRFFEQGRSVIFAGGHYNNWEIFAVAVDEMIRHKAIGIYKPLSNKYFDEKMRNTRSKYGLYMISTRDVKKVFDEEAGRLTATIFAIDQSPSNPDNCYWMEFLHQDTGILFGAEKYAKEYNYPVIYGRINKEKRGHYSFELFVVTENPKETAYGEITEKATKMLEQDIRNQPEYWLWTHRRWKHKKPAGWNKETKAMELQMK